MNVQYIYKLRLCLQHRNFSIIGDQSSRILYKCTNVRAHLYSLKNTYDRIN